MALTKEKKIQLLDVFGQIAKDSGSIVFVHARGLSVADTTVLRNSLAEAGCGYKVVKKTLLKRALAAAGITGELPTMEGEIAVAYSADLTAPAREVFNFAKKFEGKMSMAGGVFEGRFMDKAEITAIATIPPTQVLRGMFVNVINSPIQGMVIALSKIAEQKAA
jgi:large subunit ribosomal protein L10